MTQQTRKRHKTGTHPFVLDTELPPDTNGRGVCRRCHLVGTPDDAHHHMPDVPEQAEHRGRYEPEHESTR